MSNSEVLNVISITLNNEVKIHNQLNEKSSEWLSKRSLSPNIDLDDFVLTLEATVKNYMATNFPNEWDRLTPDQKSTQSFSTVSGYLASEMLKLKEEIRHQKKTKAAIAAEQEKRDQQHLHELAKAREAEKNKSA
jgi:hypothetical protein